jgi:hypothetical protein
MCTANKGCPYPDLDDPIAKDHCSFHLWQVAPPPRDPEVEEVRRSENRDAGLPQYPRDEATEIRKQFRRKR